MLFADSGAYKVQADLSLKKLVGVEWDTFHWEDDIDGMFYTNAGDYDRVYYLSGDGSKSIKLADGKNSNIVLISKY
ncbi:MAG TPA: hypothetical protein VHP38_11545 [Ruminiclostridium sp.]|nr:hypothetical protein [Ruminiclostridium sp.]